MGYLVKENGIIVCRSIIESFDISYIFYDNMYSQHGLRIKLFFEWYVHGLQIAYNADSSIKNISIDIFTINNDEFNEFAKKLHDMIYNFDDYDQSQLLNIFDESMRYFVFFDEQVKDLINYCNETLSCVRLNPQCKSAMKIN